MKIHIESSQSGPLEDTELETLLKAVYVKGGFTPPELAESLFSAAAVRKRGEILFVRNPLDAELLGMVIVVPPHSPARRLAQAEEVEMHLLAVLPKSRGSGLGRALVNQALAVAKQAGYERMVLWTQPVMLAAQQLYLSAGFVRNPKRDHQQGTREFLVFEAIL